MITKLITKSTTKSTIKLSIKYASHFASKYDSLPNKYAGKTLRDVCIIRARSGKLTGWPMYRLKVTYLKRTRYGWIQFDDKIYCSKNHDINPDNEDRLDRYKPLLKLLGCDPNRFCMDTISTTICDAIKKGTVITTTLKPTLNEKGRIKANPGKFKVHPLASTTTTK